MRSSKLRLRTIAMARIALCTALLCVSAQIAVPLPIGVPFTLQVMVTLLVALILKPLHALCAQALYTLIGLCGLPVFSGGRGGLGAVLSPTGGFILGFLFAAFLVSWSKGRQGSFPRYLLAAVVGLPCIYLPGIVFYMLFTGADLLSAVITLTSVFILIDLAKCVLAALIAVPVNRALARVTEKEKEKA